MISPLGDLTHEGQQFVRRSGILAETLTRPGLVCFVQDDDAKAHAQQMLFLRRIAHHQPGGDDANPQRAAVDLLAARRRNGALVRIQPHLTHRVPTRGRDAELVQHLGLPLLDQRGGGEDHHRAARAIVLVGE